jgi:hypothetical protein
MQYYAAFNMILMLIILVQIISGAGGMMLALWGLAGELVAIALGNWLAYGRMRRSYAEIFFVGDHFSLISVYEMLFSRQEQRPAFPLAYANAGLSPEGDVLTFHFNDQVISLYRRDWDNFDLMCAEMAGRTGVRPEESSAE